MSSKKLSEKKKQEEGEKGENGEEKEGRRGFRGEGGERKGGKGRKRRTCLGFPKKKEEREGLDWSRVWGEREDMSRGMGEIRK